jgi:lantibiotic modifying enzyme
MNLQRDRFLETAARIGARICRDAIWAGYRCNWLGDSMEKLDGAWKVAHRALTPDLYGGTSGIALFLNRLHDFTGEKIFRETAEGAIHQACSRIPYFSPPVKPGFYLGVTGVAYALSSMGREDQARHALDDVTQVNASNGAGDFGWDVIGGIAGAIPPLLSLGISLSAPACIDRAYAFGEDLLRCARKSDSGWSWNTLHVPDDRREQDLTGFSHGSAGIAWAFSELYSHFQDARFRHAAQEARRYENSHFDPRQSNWPDFRYLYDPDSSTKDGPTYPISWCHGAPGVGLDRLRAYQIFGEPSLREEAQIAIRTTEPLLKYTKGSNFSLCHGIGGNADLAIYASEVLDDPAHMSSPEQVGDQGIEEIESQDLRWPCGVTDGDQTPNLMLGTAGIGYFYLRLYDWHNTPPVTILPVHAHERAQTLGR